MMRVQLEPIILFLVAIVTSLLWCGLLQINAFGGMDPDFSIVSLLIFFVILGTMFGTMHFSLNLAGLSTGHGYIWGGSIAMMITVTSVPFEPETWGPAPERSALLVYGAAVILGGAMAFAYREFAGLVPAWETEKPELKAWLNAAASDEHPVRLAGKFEGYTGPVQVRTSLTRMVLAQASPWALIYLGWLCCYLTGLYQYDANLVPIAHEPGTSYDLSSDAVISGRMAALLGLAVLLAVLVQTVFAMGVHLACRFVGIRHILGYVFMGIVLPSIVFIAFPASFPMVGTIAVGMAIYRKIAGLEPKSLPERVHVSDQASLVAADHPLRRMRQIVPRD